MSILNKKEIIASLDEDFDLDWGLKSIGVEDVWKFTKGKGIKVVVVDTGADLSHPDLEDKISGGIDFIKQTGIATDKNGHGTMVAGLIAGKRTGVAPDVELYIAKSLNEDGKGTARSIMDGITFAININADIVCMSLGMQNELPNILKRKIETAHAKGITIVCPTGNLNNKKVDYPAFMKEVVGVGGADSELKLAEFSNYGEGTDVIAPAVDILSTYKNGNYAKMSGTSFASALVTGAIALLMSAYREEGINLSPKDVKEIISSINESKSEDYPFFDFKKLIDFL